MALRLVTCFSSNLFAEGIKKLLEREEDVHVVGSFSGDDFRSDLTEACDLRPDILLLDGNADLDELLGLPDEFFARNETKILIIGDRNTRFMIHKNLRTLLSKGVVGVLPPSADSDILKKSLRAIIVGELWLDRATLMKILTHMKRAAPYVRLAKREKEIILYISQGYRNKEIAEKLQISERTVKSHCTRIYKKLGVNDRLQLALQSHKIWSGDVGSK